MHSGGFNSTFALKYWLDQGHDVLVHHVDLGERVERDFVRREALACKAIHEHLGIPQNRIFRSVCKPLHLDGTIVRTLVAAIAATTVVELMLRKEHIDQWAMGWWQGSREVARGEPARCQEVMKAVLPPVNRWNVPPLATNAASFDHAEVVRIMGRDLVELTWSCHYSDDSGACGKCPKCKRFAKRNVDLSTVPAQGIPAPTRDGI